MPATLTQHALNEVLDHLSRAAHPLKARLLQSLKEYYDTGKNLSAITAIPAEAIIQKVWGIKDPEEIQQKQNHLECLKASLNAELRQLRNDGNNPEGIFIGPHNIFMVPATEPHPSSDQDGLERKPSRSLNEVVSSFDSLVSEMQQLGSDAGADGNVSGQEPSEIEKTRKHLQDLAKRKTAPPGRAESSEPRKSASAAAPRRISETAPRENRPATDSKKTRRAGERSPSGMEIEEVARTVLATDASVAELLPPGLESDHTPIPEARKQRTEAPPRPEPLQNQEESAPAQETADSAALEVEEVSGEGEQACPTLIFADDAGSREGDAVESGRRTAAEKHRGSEAQLQPEKNTGQLVATLSQLFEPSGENTPPEEEAEAEPYLTQFFSRFHPEYIKIPAGEYLVGSKTPQELEFSLRSVQLEDFLIGKYPVTNDLFQAFVQETGYLTDAEKEGYGMVVTDSASAEGSAMTIGRDLALQEVEGACWRHPAGPGSTIAGQYHHPVVQVSFADAEAFAAWAGSRLPSEEEWEAAARGSGDRPHPWGSDWSAYRANVLASQWGGTKPVNFHGAGSESPFGIYDLIGNVYEWTTTTYRRPLEDQEVPRPRPLLQVLKGGSWATHGRVTVAHRLAESPRLRANITGFRCAGSGAADSGGK